MKTQAILSVLLCPSLLLAQQTATPERPSPYNPASPPQIVLLTKPPVLQPTEVVLAPVVIIIAGGAAIGGGIWIWNKVLRMKEHILTNGAPAAVVFTLEPEDESGQ